MTRFSSTAYGPPWGGIQGTGVTATGIDLRPARVYYLVAVDPTVIPLHTRLLITPNPFGGPVIFRAEDTGGAIKGNRIDFYDWRGRASQLRWGRRWVEVTRLDKQPQTETRRPNPRPARPLPAGLELEPAPEPAGPSHLDYAPIVRASAVNVHRGGVYLRDAGRALRSMVR